MTDPATELASEPDDGCGDDFSAWRTIAAYFEDNALLLSAAESCSAGALAALLGEMIAGQDDRMLRRRWLRTCFVTYSQQSEQQVLGVSDLTIQRYGLHSEAVATEMAIAALDHSDANIAVANVGVAGPQDAPDGTKAGTVCFAWAMLAGGWVRTASTTELFSGSRDEVRRQAARYAVAQLPSRHKELVRGEKEALQRRFA